MIEQISSAFLGPKGIRASVCEAVYPDTVQKVAFDFANICLPPASATDAAAARLGGDSSEKCIKDIFPDASKS